MTSSILAIYTKTLTAIGNTFCRNTAGRGGALWLGTRSNRRDLVLTHNVLHRNTAGNGGAARFDDYASPDGAADGYAGAREANFDTLRFIPVPDVGTRDNFFELGGHSLLAMEVTALLDERDGIRIDPRELFFKTLRQLGAGVADS